MNRIAMFLVLGMAGFSFAKVATVTQEAIERELNPDSSIRCLKGSTSTFFSPAIVIMSITKRGFDDDLFAAELLSVRGGYYCDPYKEFLEITNPIKFVGTRKVERISRIKNVNGEEKCHLSFRESVALEPALDKYKKYDLRFESTPQNTYLVGLVDRRFCE